MNNSNQILFKAAIEVYAHGVKKNNKVIRFNRKTNQRFISSNPQVKSLESDLVQKLKRKFKGETITGSINAEFLFYYPKSVYFTKKGVRSKNIADLSNLYELPQDALTKAGVIEDDRIIDSHDGSRRIPNLDDKYILVITLTQNKG